MATANGNTPTWVYVLLGIVMIIAGVIVLGDVVAATLISAILIGVLAIVSGAFEIVHAFWTKGWGGFLWQILLGLLYIAFGVLLVTQPVSGALFLTWLLGLLILVSGVIRIFVGTRDFAGLGWVLVVSGVFGILAGIVILTGWPATGLWVIGFLLGIDLIIHGIGWVMLALRPSASMQNA